MKLIENLVGRVTTPVRGILGKVTGIAIPKWLKIAALVLVAAIVLGIVL